jgi:hypothetical protein
VTEARPLPGRLVYGARTYDPVLQLSEPTHDSRSHAEAKRAFLDIESHLIPRWTDDPACTAGMHGLYLDGGEGSAAPVRDTGAHPQATYNSVSEDLPYC